MVTVNTHEGPLVTIGTRIEVPGFHRWPDARGKRAYLSQRHRHLFGIEAVVRVGHDERDVEFHDLQELLRGWWGLTDRECDSDSCETLARKLAAYLTTFGIDVASITVSEDGESWATYSLHPPITRKA